ncbi:MAG TPA: tetratricopeptide repeat protein, partial [Candidatus Synoicihabitans sp.]|nr:tetratricopeptide repeat protein [Candidatus Synoicihabitans sp.]
ARAEVLRSRAQVRKDPPISDPWLDEIMERCFDEQQLALRFEDFAKSGLQDQALATLRRLEIIAPDHRLVHQMRGLAAAQQGRDDEALREYETALAHGARNPELLMAVAFARLKQGDATTACQRLEEALQLAPEHPAANATLARVHWEAGRRSAAVPYLETVRRVVPDDLVVRAMLGEYRLEESRPAEAVAALTEAHALDPENEAVGELLALAHVRVGNSLAREREFDAALAAYDRAIAVRAGSLEAHANKVQILVRLQRSDEAVHALEAWLASQPAEPAAWLMLGDVQRASGQSEQSLESWSRAQQLLASRPDSRVEQALRERLGAVATP